MKTCGKVEVQLYAFLIWTPLLANRDYLFNIFRATPSYLGAASYIHNLRRRKAVATRGRTSIVTFLFITAGFESLLQLYSQRLCFDDKLVMN
jgi:hypothetical protein